MPKKLPFTKENYLKMLDSKLGGSVVSQPTNVFDRLKQAAQKAKTLKR